MKILHVITGLQKAAGTSTFCGEVCNQLVVMGHEVTVAVCNPDAPNTYPLDSKIRVVSIQAILENEAKPRRPSSSESNNSTVDLLSRPTFSLIHIHGLWSPILHCVSNWAHVHGIPVIWSTHGMTAPWALKHKWWKKWLPWYLYQKRDLERARIIHCTSDFEVEWNRKLGFGRTFLAPLGTFLPEVKKVGRESRSTADDRFSDSNIRTLLFVGRIYPVKALDRLIEAFAMAIKNLNLHCPPPPTFSTFPWRLRLVGPDQAGHMFELKDLCDKLGLSYVDLLSRPTFSSRPQVEFAGPKYGADLDAEYANCTALALVSHTENFGATVVDALAHGKPVVTSTKTPWKIVSDRHCGWWVDNDVKSLSNALAQFFVSSPSVLCEMGRRGRALVEEKYTWKAVAKAVEEAYNDARYDCEFAPCGSCEKCYDTCSPERIIR